MKNKTISLVVYLITGILIGYISFLLKNNLLALFSAIVVLVLIKYVLGKILKIQKPFNWFLANGGALYLFIWFITWIILYNL